jgi:hypothetical protein
VRTDRITHMTKLIVAFTILRKHLTIHKTLQLFTFCVAATRLCVLQTAVASLQSPDCDIEWLVGVNVVTGGVLCRRGIVTVYGSFAVDTDCVHKTANQYVSLYLKLAINTEL